MTEAALFDGRRKASMKPQETNCNVRRTFGPGVPNNTVHFNYGDVRIGFSERQEIIIGAADSAFRVDFVLNGF